VARAAWASAGTPLPPTPFLARCRPNVAVSPCGPCRLEEIRHAELAAYRQRQGRHVLRAGTALNSKIASYAFPTIALIFRYTV
jgi:hypothetical protein